MHSQTDISWFPRNPGQPYTAYQAGWTVYTATPTTSSWGKSKQQTARKDSLFPIWSWLPFGGALMFTHHSEQAPYYVSKTHLNFPVLFRENEAINYNSALARDKQGPRSLALWPGLKTLCGWQLWRGLAPHPHL